MKNILLAIVFSAALIFVLICSCDEEVSIIDPCTEAESCIPGEFAQVESVCSLVGEDSSRYFCPALTNVWNSCIFENTCVSATQVGNLAAALNDFWDQILELLSKESFSDQEVKNAINTLVSGQIKEFKSAILSFMMEINLCDGYSPLTIPGFKYGMFPVFEELGYSCSGRYWDMIDDYVGIFGLTTNQACGIFNSNISSLNESMYLVDGGDITGSYDQSFIVYPDCEFSVETLNENAPQNLTNLFTFWTDDSNQTCTEWNSLIDGMLANEFETFVNQLVNLIADIVLESNDLSIINSIAQNMPLMIAVFISEELDNCEED